ncbi:hypothetical protein P43SY_008282 [Pythium insidiosum]|uniref:Uncharacterized protein n=1 Tax=Pythium insidiosum TaxID=114742 RepID=A0AAD5Q9X3_PYTIN|nr:hypothetical protein P43SY_008282 [Pythium insidiosum]
MNMALAGSAPSPAATRAPALDRLLLPLVRVKGPEKNSKQLEQRFNYLWNAAHAVVAASPDMAHTLVASIMQLARQHRVELPPAVLDYVCRQCGGLLVPGVTAEPRVVALHHRSPLNRKLARVQRAAIRRHQHGAIDGARPKREALLNVVALRCPRCHHVNARPGASVVLKPKAKKRPLAEDASLGAGDPAAKRPKTDAAKDTPLTPQANAEPAPVATRAPEASADAAAVRSVFAPPPSPPRKLLDGPAKKKKKKKPTEPATSAVKSSLNSFLDNLRPSFAK